LRKSFVIHYEYSIHTLCPLIIYATYTSSVFKLLLVCINYRANAPTNKKVDNDYNIIRVELNKKLMIKIGVDDLYHKASNT